MANLTIKERNELVEVYNVLENRDFISILNRIFSVKQSFLKKFIMIK